MGQWEGKWEGLAICDILSWLYLYLYVILFVELYNLALLYREK